MPAGVLFSGIALPPLQNPLQRVIDDPPARAELRYEAIGGVRWACGAVLIVWMPPVRRWRLAHPCVGRSLIITEKIRGLSVLVSLVPCVRISSSPEQAVNRLRGHSADTHP